MEKNLARNCCTVLLLSLLAFVWSCTGTNTTENTTDASAEGNNTTAEARKPKGVVRTDFGRVNDDTPVYLYSLTNARGTEVQITNYGGIVTSIKVPDRVGNIEDVTLGFDDLQGYLQDGVPYFGALIGRFGNRIADGKFTLDGKTYNLATNNGPNHLHGGIRGFDKVVWESEELSSDEAVGLKLLYTSKDGEEGYPGNLAVEVIYSLTDANELRIEYQATTDKATIVNLTNHTYFNLSGNLDEPILDHVVQINADHFLPVNENLIPTGELRPVAGTPFDFTQPRAIGERINQQDEQLLFGGGYDHCWVLNGQPGTMRLAGSVYHEGSGRLMEVFTTEPGIQLYTGNFLDGSLEGKGVRYNKRTGLCLETQHFPDSPNKPEFPSVTLRPGETYSTKTTYKFSTRD